MKWPPRTAVHRTVCVSARCTIVCVCTRRRRRQPPPIGEYRPIFGASRRKRRGRKRQSLRRSSFTAFCRLSRRFPLLPASNNPGGWAIDLAMRGQMDNSLSTLKKCRHLSLSSHSIEKISNLSGLGARTNRPLSVCFVASNELRGVAWRGVAWRGVLARRSIPAHMAACLRAPPYKPLRCVCVPPTSQLEHIEVVSR